MSLDIYLSDGNKEVHRQSITDNLSAMAKEAGFYSELWWPEKSGISQAGQLAEKLAIGIKKMKEDPDSFRLLEASNGRGTYDQFISWLDELLSACNKYPDAGIFVSN